MAVKRPAKKAKLNSKIGVKRIETAHAMVLRGDLERTERAVAGLQGTLTRSEEALADALERLRELEAKVRRIAADPVVQAPHELKRRVEDLELKVEENRKGLAFELAGRAMAKDFHDLAQRTKDVEATAGAQQLTLDNHEDRLDALEEAVTSVEAPKLSAVPNPN